MKMASRNDFEAIIQLELELASNYGTLGWENSKQILESRKLVKKLGTIRYTIKGVEQDFKYHGVIWH